MGKKGLFFVFDGIDGSGHTTAVNEVGRVLKGKGLKVIVTTEPTEETEEGREARKLLKNHDKVDPLLLQNLFIKDRKNHVRQINKWLNKGFIVLCDRYIYSSLAYGSAVGVDTNLIIDLNKSFLRPDIAFILDVAPEVAISRIKKRDVNLDRFENLEILKKTRENFLKLSQDPNFKEIVIVDASRPVSQVKAFILSKLLTRL